MQVTMLKAKLHRACVTQCYLDYEGSCAIDTHLLKVSGICEYEQIQIYNLNNGERFTTYVIAAQEGSGVISLNGAASRKAQVNDRIIICSYCRLEQAKVKQFKPALVYLDECNQITHTRHFIPTQVANQ